MTRYDIPVLAKVDPVSWAQFKAECADFHDRLAVELQTDFPTHIIQKFPDINPCSNRRTILAARDEYVAHLGGMLTTLNILMGQPLSERITTSTATPAPNPDEEEEWEDHDPTADDDNDNNEGEDEVPNSPAPRPATPTLPPQVPRVYAPPAYPPPRVPPPHGPPPASFRHPEAPVWPPQVALQPQQGMITFQQVMQMIQAMQPLPEAIPAAPVAPVVPTPPVAHAAPPIHYKIAMPTKYDGTPSRCMDFLAECENYFVMTPMTDEQRVRFTLQLLDKGANMWKHTSLRALDNQPVWKSDWESFRAYFEGRFRDRNKREKAVDELMSGALKQTRSARDFIENEREKAVDELMSGALRQTHSARDFINRVQDTCKCAGWNTQLQWMDVVRNGLKPDLARALVGRYPRRWEEFVEVVVATDEDLQILRVRENRSTAASKRARRGTPSSDRPPRMTPEERERHRKEGLCYYCHEKGHRAIACPK